uniref:Uncharacterized protein n=1 Tax=Plectus sambesii TaxID=2011161 RepID=A0A914WG77_9BILA
MASPSSPTCRSVDDAPSLAPMATKKPRPSSSKRGTLKRADTFNEGSMPLTLFHHLQGNTLIRKEKSYDSLADTQDPPPPEHLTRRDALVPEEKKITPGDSHLYNRAITSGGSVLAGLQKLHKATVAAQAFYSDTDEAKKSRSPWILKRLFSKGPSTISAYQAYCINYKATMEYLESMRQDERFIEYERVCLGDQRCHRLQLEDLLISPLHRITRLPLLLKEVHKYTDDFVEKYHIERIIETLHESLRSIDDSVQWLHNFERLQQLQSQVVWPSIMDLEPRPFIPEFLKLALSRQFCENLLAHPRRKLIHEGYLECIESGKSTDLYAFLFNDMLLLTKAKKTVGRPKTANSKKSPGVVPKMDHINRYIVQRQPVPLDSCVFCDVGPHDVSNSVPLRFAFVIIHLTRFYQVVSVYTLQAASKEEKDQWIHKFQESIENYESIQLKDMLKCTPLLSNSMSSFRCGSTTGGDARNVSRRVSREVSVQTLEDEDRSLSSPHQRQSSTDAEFSRPSALLTPDASHSGASRC